MSTDDPGAIQLPARTIPTPTSLSEEARGVLAARQPPSPGALPPLDDAAAWRAHVVEHDEELLDAVRRRFGGMLPEVSGQTTRHLDGFDVYVTRPADVVAEDRRVVLDIHGGGFVRLGGAVCALLAMSTVKRFGTEVWSVDYRMPPDHPYPTPLDDCVAAYRALLAERSPGEIVVAGESAGGNLAAAMVLRARDEGLPLPAALVLRTPLSDLEANGDTLVTNLGLDNVLGDGSGAQYRLYAGGHDIAHPYLSPVNGDFAAGFPTTLLLSGTRDLFLSFTVRMHRALRRQGVAAELHVVEGAGHGLFFGAAPEDQEIDAEVRAFAQRHWSTG